MIKRDPREIFHAIDIILLRMDLLNASADTKPEKLADYLRCKTTLKQLMDRYRARHSGE